MAIQPSKWVRSRRTWGVVHLALGLAFSVVLGWLAIRGLDWTELARQLRGFSPGYGAAALGVFLAAMVLRAYRWQVLFVQQPVALRHLFLVQMVGIGINNLSPWRVFSEAIQFVLLTRRYQVHGGVAVATLGVERALDLVSSAVLLVVGLLLLPRIAGLTTVLSVAVVMALASVVLLRGLAWASGRPWTKRVPLLGPLAQALAAVEHARGRLVWALALTFFYWVAIGTTGWLVGLGLAVDVDIWEVMLVLILALYVTTVVPALPGAAGTFEFAIVYILAFFGIPQAPALSFSLIVHAILFLPPIALALALLPRLWWRTPR